ncbi:MAG: hypothetical protein L0H55_16390 [Candidatus Nitrosocosmicus sp.]|nr:hypothetical protein [Candidatus Nitrosocosmicus sp.]
MFKEWKDRGTHLSEYLQIFLKNKKYLFIGLSISFISIVIYPLVLPHITHPSMIYHIIVHIIGFDIALFLTFVSALSFKRTRNFKILLTSVSFGVLLLVELLYLLESTDLLGEFHLPIIGVEFSHLLMILMLSLFAIGILRVEKDKTSNA